MTLFSVFTRFLTLAPLALLLSGCAPLGMSPEDEKRDPHYLSGKNRLSAMDYDGAIHAFEAALASNPKSSSAHLELGLLYEEKKNNYATAIHHYQRHLELRPDSNMAETIKQRIFACTFELAKTVPYAILSRQAQEDIRKAQATNTMLLSQIEILKAQLAEQASVFSNHLALQSERVGGAQVPQQSAPLPERRAVLPDRTPERMHYPIMVSPSSRPISSRPVNGPRAHIVRSGETMASIARRYGVPLRTLTAANPRIEPRRLRPGQVVNVPGN